MNTESSPEALERNARALLDVLQRRQDVAPTIARAALLEELGASLEQVDATRPLPALLRSVNASSLGTVVASELRSRTPPAVTASIVDIALQHRPTNATGADEPTSVAGVAVHVEGPIADWMREIARLRAESGLDNDKLLVELNGLGLVVTRTSLVDTLDAMPASSDRELVRSIVTVLGGDWSGRGYEASFDAARDEQRRLEGGRPSAALREAVSGLAGADALTPSTLLRQVQAPYDRLPERLRGREALLDQVKSVLDGPAPSVQILTGHSGVGKSTIALAVAAIARDRGHRVWWVAAGDPNQLTRGLLAIATQLGSPVAELNAIQDAPQVGAPMLARRLESSPTRWLIIFDGADDPELFTYGRDGASASSWLVRSSVGATIVTSRVGGGGAWPPGAEEVPVPDLSEDAGALVLLDHMTLDPDARIRELDPARRVAERLGGVALALRILGTYLGSSFSRHGIDEVLQLEASAPGPDLRQASSTKRGLWRCKHWWRPGSAARRR